MAPSVPPVTDYTPLCTNSQDSDWTALRHTQQVATSGSTLATRRFGIDEAAEGKESGEGRDPLRSTGKDG